MKNLFILALFLLSSLDIFSQSFLMPLQDIPASQQIYVVTKNNQTIYGKMRMSVWMTGQLKSFTMISEDGEKLKYKAEEVQELGVRMNDWVRLQLRGEAMSSIKKAQNTDMDVLLNREWILFEQVMMPGNKAKYSLLQILNPGFDNKIKVFENPRAAKTAKTSVGGFAITGGEDRAFLVSKEGKQSFVVKKGSYDKSFGDLYGSCPQLVKEFSGEKIQFKNMAQHVMYFEENCD
jgi:hypothetical protein